MAHGANNIYEGATGEDGILREGYQAALGQDTGDITYGAIDLGTSAVSLGRNVVSPNSWRLFRNIPSDYVHALQVTSTPALIGLGAVDVNTIVNTTNRINNN